MNISYDIQDYTLPYYQDVAPVIKAARPWCMVHEPRAKHAVLCLHGYAGYPGELVRPGIDLYEKGMDVFAPRYPGFGTSGNDFLASSVEDWLGTAYDAAQALTSSYDEVSVVGHSMGGAMAVLIASAFSLKRAVLLSPVFILPKLKPWQLRLLKLLKKRIAVPWHSDKSFTFFYEGDEGDDERLGAEYWSWLYPKSLLGLDHIRRMAVAALDTFTTDTLIITGDDDAIIPKESAQLFLAQVKGRATHLTIANGTHYLPYDRDAQAREKAMHACTQFLETVQ